MSEIFAKAAQALGIPVLTPEYEIVIALVDVPNLTADQLFERSSMSRAGFFNTIERLKTWNILMANSGLDDRRRRIYRLSGDRRQLIVHRFREYRAGYDDYGKGAKDSQEFITKELTAQRDKGLDYFTCEFKILFYLFLTPNMPNNALRSLIDASDTKFHNTIRSLLEDDLVTAVADAGDKRLKLYSSSCRVRLGFQMLHSDIFDWLDRFEPLVLSPEHIYAHRNRPAPTDDGAVASP